MQMCFQSKIRKAQIITRPDDSEIKPYFKTTSFHNRLYIQYASPRESHNAVSPVSEYIQGLTISPHRPTEMQALARASTHTYLWVRTYVYYIDSAREVAFLR